MRVLCRHGHFAFYPRMRDDVVHFQKLYRIPIVAEPGADYFTFPTLRGLPNWSQVGRPFGLLQPTPAIMTYAGDYPWEMMKANGVVFSPMTQLLVPFASVVGVVTLPQTRFTAISPVPLIHPGSVILGGLIPGDVLLGYQGELDLDRQRLYIYAQETLLQP